MVALDQHIEVSADICGGKPRIAGHRITVQEVAIWHERLGMSVDEIATVYNLSLADVHAALAYYFDNRVELDAKILADEELEDLLRKSTPSKLNVKVGR